MLVPRGITPSWHSRFDHVDHHSAVPLVERYPYPLFLSLFLFLMMMCISILLERCLFSLGNRIPGLRHDRYQIFGEGKWIPIRPLWGYIAVTFGIPAIFVIISTHIHTWLHLVADDMWCSECHNGIQCWKRTDLPSRYDWFFLDFWLF